MAAVDAMCPLPLDCSGTYGTLTVAGWSMHTGAWCVWDLSELFGTPQFRGDNVLVESQVGRKARPMMDDETIYSLPMMFSGAVDRLGNPWGNPAGGLLANRRQFVAQLIQPVRASTSGLAASLAFPDGGVTTTWQATVQPLGLEWTLLPGGYARAVLSLRVPAGRFA